MVCCCTGCALLTVFVRLVLHSLVRVIFTCFFSLYFKQYLSTLSGTQPPGCGKTSVVVAVAREMRARLFCFDGTASYDSRSPGGALQRDRGGAGGGGKHVNSNANADDDDEEEEDAFVGQTELQLRRIFERARRAAAEAAAAAAACPGGDRAATTVILFLDDLDTWCTARDAHGSSPSSGGARVVAQLLALLDGQRSNAGVVVVGAAARTHTIDAALRRAGRCEAAFLAT